MARKIVIVGAGIAGMTAAKVLLEQGKRERHPFDVTILEARDVPGGQATSFRIQPKAPGHGAHRGGGEIPGEAPFVVEHGSHVFFKYYDTIMKIIDELRSDPELGPSMPALYQAPGWTIVDAYGTRGTLQQGPVLPEPYNVFPSILGLSWMPLVDRVRIGIGALKILGYTFEQLDELDKMTSLELGLASGYTRLGLMGWNSASLGLTNLFVQEQSAAIFAAKHKVLFQYPDGLSYQLPAGDLFELIAVPLSRKVVKLGAKLLLDAKVTHLSRPDGAATTEVTYHGKHHGTIQADHVILAVPPKAAAKLAPWVSAPWDGLGPVSPVVTVVMRLSGQLETSASGDELGLSREQWAFSVVTDLSRFWPLYEGLGKTVIRCEIGHADLLPFGPNTADDEVINLLRQDLERLFPEMLDRGITIEAYAIHREEHLLYTRWAKGAWVRKPKERDLGQGVFLAGDWTTKGTIGMEAAANSGVEAANHVLLAAKLPPVPFRDVPI